MQPMEQFLQLSQMLKVSPTMLQSIHILQMNVQSLADYLSDCSERNPLLELDETQPIRAREEMLSHIPWARQSECSPIPEPWQDSEVDSLPVLLLDQLSRLSLSPPLRALSEYLIDFLDDNGYLSSEDLASLRKAGVPPSLLEDAVVTLQSLEPAGIAARNLSECLSLQLSRTATKHALASSIVSLHLDDLAKKRYKSIAQAEGCSLEEVTAAAQLILSLNPHPGRNYEQKEPTGYIQPDAWAVMTDGHVHIFCNQWDIPQLRLSQEYVTLLQQSSNPEDQTYLRENLRESRWLLHCVAQRNSTLQTCNKEIVTWQKAYFSGESHVLSPMTQYEIADQMGMHPSTISRAIRNKYLACQNGLFPLSSFFSAKLGTGTAYYSETMAKAKIKALISFENPLSPLSDEALARLLKAEGMPLARRTVSKYRGELGILNSYQRRK